MAIPTCQREGWPAGKGQVPKPRRISDALKLLAQMQLQNDGTQADGNGGAGKFDKLH